MYSTLPKNLRLFVGTFLTDEGRSRISKLQAKYGQKLIQSWNTKPRWVDESKLHLTWFFLGEIRQDLVGQITKKVEDALGGVEKMSVKYDRLELWPSPRKPRLLVLSASSLPEKVEETSSALREILNPYVEKKETRRFRPHITLARLPRDFHGELSLPDELKEDDLIPFDHDLQEISLIESQMGTPGVPYVPLKSFTLN